MSSDFILFFVVFLFSAIDNKTVFNFQQIKRLHLSHNIFIISQKQTINRICQFTGKEGTIKIIYYQLDINTSESENNTQLFSITDTDITAFQCLDSKR